VAIPVSVSGLALTGSLAGNYVLTSAFVTADIGGHKPLFRFPITINRGNLVPVNAAATCLLKWIR